MIRHVLPCLSLQHTKTLLQNLFPSRCYLCHDRCFAPLCSNCQTYLQQPQQRCSRCPQRLLLGAYCTFCQQKKFLFDQCFSVSDYQFPLQHLIHTMKFARQPSLARWLGAQMAHTLHATLTDALLQPQLFCPVPLSKQRLATRGYNQSWELLRGMSKVQTLKSYATLLTRKRDTATQSLAQSDQQRQQNVAHAFVCKTTIEGLHIGLVDDVLTSGATLEAASKALKDAGASMVSVFVLARTPRAGVSATTFSGVS